MLHLIEATRFHLNGELTEHDLWFKQKFERVKVMNKGGQNLSIPTIFDENLLKFVGQLVRVGVPIHIFNVL